MKIFLCISSFQVLAMFRRGLFYSYLSIYLRHFLGLSVTATTLFTTLPMIVNVLAQRFLWGVMTDRMQKRRRFIVAGELLAGAGTILLFYAHRIPERPEASGWVLIWGLALIEVFWSMSNIGWSTLIADLFRQGSRSRIMGRLEGMGGLGRIAGVACGGLFYDNMGKAFPGWGFYEGALFWVSGLVMFVSVFPMFLVPEGGVAAGERGTTASAGKTGASRPALFYTFILAITLIHFGRNAVAVILPQYLTLDTGPHLSPMLLGHVMNLRSAGLIMTGMLTGLVCKRLEDRSGLLISAIAAALALVMLATLTDLRWVCLSSFISGMSEVIIIAASYELAAAYIPPEKRGTGFALFNATLFLSWGVGATLISGPITDGLIAAGRPDTIAYRAAFWASAAMTLAGILTLILLYRMERRSN